MCANLRHRNLFYTWQIGLFLFSHNFPIFCEYVTDTCDPTIGSPCLTVVDKALRCVVDMLCRFQDKAFRLNGNRLHTGDDFCTDVGRHLLEDHKVIENHCINGGITDKDCKDLVIKTSKVTRSVFNFIKEIDGTRETLKCKLIAKIAEQTNYRPEKVELNVENKQMFHTLVTTMESYPGMVKFGNISLDLSSEVSKNIQFLNDNKAVPSAIDMLAYNGIIERRYLE